MAIRGLLFCFVRGSGESGVVSSPLAFFGFTNGCVFTIYVKYTRNDTTDTPINPHVINQL